MNNRQHRTIAAFERGLLYFKQHPIEPEPPLLVEVRESLLAVIERIGELGMAQRAAEQDMKGHVEGRKRALRRKRMLVLKRLAGKEFRFSPMEGVLQVPHQTKSAHEVGAAALVMADAFEPHRDLITRAGHPGDFLDQMRREAHNLQLSAKRSGTARNRRSLATRDMAEEFSRGMMLLDQLEGLVMSHHGSDAKEVRYWTQWRRVQKRIGRPRPRKVKVDRAAMP